ncbi:MAG: hypothetical protein JW832_00625 [Deltaproteobacteria bacterium]|nr:hypothetical protein [Deltaproteobacteria bacterium]
MEKNNQPDTLDVFKDPVFIEIFLPLYKSYKTLDRDFDKKVIDKDIENLCKKFQTIAASRERRKPQA